MASDILSVIFSVFLAFLPILFWGYAFSYLDADRLNAKRFFLGLAAGSAAVFPVAFMPEALAWFPGVRNVFSSIASRIEPLPLALDFAFFLALVALAVCLVSVVLRPEIFKDFKVWRGSLAALALSVPLFALFALALFALFPQGVSPEIRIAGATISGFAAIATSYFVVAAVEEGGKHLGLYGASESGAFAKKGAIYAAFVALGFAFSENVLYLSSLFSSDASASSILGTWFSRSVFSVPVHVLCSLAAALPFVAALKRAETGVKVVRAVFIGLSVSIAFHLVFDVTVSYGKTGIVFLYFAFAYVYLTRAFHRPEEA